MTTTGAVTSVNEYQIVKDLGKGAFAEVKLCKKYTGVVPPVSPEEKDFKGLSAQESLEDAKDLFVSPPYNEWEEEAMVVVVFN